MDFRGGKGVKAAFKEVFGNVFIRHMVYLVTIIQLGVAVGVWLK